MRISFFKGSALNISPDEIFDGDFKELAEMFSTYRPNKKKHDGYITRGEVTIKSLSPKDKKEHPTRLPYLRRANEGMVNAEVLVLDGDQSHDNQNSAPDPKVLHNLLKLNKINHFIYTTHSYSPPEKIKWRCVIPCVYNNAQLKSTLDKIFELFESVDYPLSNVKENWAFSQPWFLPNRATDDGKFLFFEYHDGDVYQPAAPSKTNPTKKKGVAIPKATVSKDATHQDNLTAIREGVSYYKELQNVLYGMAKDGRTKEAAYGDVEMIMYASKAAHHSDPNHEKWQARMANLVTYVEQAFHSLSSEVVEACEVVETNDYVEGNLLPDSVIVPDNLMGDLTKALLNTWWIPNKMVANMTAKSIVAYLAGGNYRGTEGDRVNFQQVALGTSGAGKDLLVNGVTSVIQEVFWDEQELCKQLMTGVVDEVASAEGVDDKMRRNGHKHDIIFVKDELGELISSANAGNKVKEGVMNYILKMYTKSGSIMNERTRASAKKSDQQDVAEILYAPHFLISGATTPELIVDGMSRSMIATGLMSRMMFFNVDKTKGERLRRIETLVLSQELKDNLKEIVNVEPMNANLHSMPGARITNPKICRFTEDAVEYCYRQALKDDTDQTEFAVIRNRRVPNAKKYAMVEAILQNPKDPVVCVKEMKRAFAFVEHSIDYTISLFSDNVGEHEQDTGSKAILKRLESVGKQADGEYGWVSRGVMINTAKFKKLDKGVGNRVIQDLVDNGQIEHERKLKSINAKKPGNYYRFASYY